MNRENCLCFWFCVWNSYVLISSWLDVFFLSGLCVCGTWKVYVEIKFWIIEDIKTILSIIPQNAFTINRNRGYITIITWISVLKKLWINTKLNVSMVLCANQSHIAEGIDKVKDILLRIFFVFAFFLFPQSGKSLYSDRHHSLTSMVYVLLEIITCPIKYILSSHSLHTHYKTLSW